MNMSVEYPGVPWTFSVGPLGLILSWKHILVKLGKRGQGFCLAIWRELYNISNDTSSTGITLLATLPWIGKREFTWRRETPN